MRVLLQFPGQLSETVGMTELPLRLHSESARLLEAAEGRTGIPVARLCAAGPERELHEDRAAAVAMIACNQMYLEALAARTSPTILGVVGHSVGYSSALVAAGVLSFEAALDVALLVDDAIDDLCAREGIDGGMGVVVGLVEAAVARIAKEAGCDVACINAATQIALSGHRDAVEAALDRAKEAGALAVHLMPMRKPMHASPLSAVAPRLEAALAKVPMSDPRLPVTSHVDAASIRTAADARQLLARQLGSQVRWRDAVRSLPRADALLECGPGDVLTRIARWIDRALPARALSEAASWPAPVEAARVGA